MLFLFPCLVSIFRRLEAYEYDVQLSVQCYYYFTSILTNKFFVFPLKYLYPILFLSLVNKGKRMTITQHSDPGGIKKKWDINLVTTIPLCDITGT